MKPVVWVGDSKERLLEFPEAVHKKIGYILEGVQAGRTSNKRVCKDFVRMYFGM